MSKFSVLIKVFVLIMCVQKSFGALTQEQMQQAANTIRNVCQPKLKVSDELVDGIKGGLFPDDKNLKCYVNCVLEMMQIIRKGKLNYDSAINQIKKMLPAHLQENYLHGVNTCRDSGNGIKDNCEASYTMLQCFYKNNPSFIFP